MSVSRSSERRSSPRSSRGLERPSAFSASASAWPILSSSSARTSLPLISFSPDAAAFLCFASSCCATVRRVCSFPTAAAASPPLASFCFWATIFRASVHAAAASFSASAAFSRPSFRASGETLSSSSEENTLQTSESALTLPSATATLSTTSARRAFIFRSSVSCLNCASFLAVSSRRFWSSPRSSLRLFATSCAYFFDSAIFVLMESFAWFTAFSVTTAAFSESEMAFEDSSCGSTSSPFRKGISADAHLRYASSALPTSSVT
mmetsp:Transcript_97997/g.302145  ORF Transcript_97997/g.302145 Transcript_97997/m.302145 type:complete len:264 (-) Transcript_97997:1101-1892(-)